MHGVNKDFCCCKNFYMATNVAVRRFCLTVYISCWNCMFTSITEYMFELNVDRQCEFD